MVHHIVNPWTWQDPLGFVQAHEVTGASRLVHCAGQASVDGNGQPLHAGDMRAQAHQALDNLERVLADAGLTLGDVVRLNYYTTDVDAFFATFQEVVSRLDEARSRPASTLLGVQRLAYPELLIEIEATAVAAGSESPTWQ
jgi:enamine deaminase RidA (YjgF/YER057c/UK114 family)